MLAHQRDNDNEPRSPINIAEELRINSEELCELARQARERAATRRHQACTLIHEVRKARALRAAEQRLLCEACLPN
jgi:hypothetical protein